MYRGIRRRSWRRSTLLVVLAIVVPQLILAAVLAAGLGVFPGRDRARVANANAKPSEQQLNVGDCVRRGATKDSSAYLAISCTDHLAFGQVLAIVAGDDNSTEGCVEDTDFFAIQQSGHATPAVNRNSAPLNAQGEVACLRRLDHDHPGAPGQGGGVYRSGDCVARTNGIDSGVREVACDDPDVFEKVVKRVKTIAECTKPAYRFATLQHGVSRVLCLGDGPGIASPNECMGDPNDTPVTFIAIDCADPRAKAKVLARTATAKECRNIPNQTHYLEDPSGLPSSRIVCLAVN